MNKLSANIITVYEHEAIRVGNGLKTISPDQLRTLQSFHENGGVKYYSLLNNGVKFCEFVGVLQIGKLTIEVLPKIDKVADSDKDSWKRILIDMLIRVGHLDVSTSNEANLRIKRNSILDLYIESFLIQVESLIHRGLIKKYRKVEANSVALKGKINFAKHIEKNIIHKERFFVKFTVYDNVNVFNKILFTTLHLVKLLSSNVTLNGKARLLLLNFPEMPDISVSEALFANMVFDRKSEPYKKAMLISKLLLLNYHPDIISGKNHVLALMFDMNKLWEKFVYVSLRKNFKDGAVEQQTSKSYWKLNGRRTVSLKPDVILVKNDVRYIIDTKWKLPSNNKPGNTDLQQMYAYTKYFNSGHTLLCYPGKDDNLLKGKFFHEEDKKNSNSYPCSILRIRFDPQEPIVKWQKRICEQVSIIT